MVQVRPRTGNATLADGVRLVEHLPSKQDVAGSSPAVRSTPSGRGRGSHPDLRRLGAFVVGGTESRPEGRLLNLAPDEVRRRGGPLSRSAGETLGWCARRQT